MPIALTAAKAVSEFIGNSKLVVVVVGKANLGSIHGVAIVIGWRLSISPSQATCFDQFPFDVLWIIVRLDLDGVLFTGLFVIVGSVFDIDNIDNRILNVVGCREKMDFDVPFVVKVFDHVGISNPKLGDLPGSARLEGSLVLAENRDHIGVFGRISIHAGLAVVSDVIIGSDGGLNQSHHHESIVVRLVIDHPVQSDTGDRFVFIKGIDGSLFVFVPS